MLLPLRGWRIIWPADVTTDRVEANVASVKAVVIIIEREDDVTNWLAEVTTDRVEDDMEEVEDDTEEIKACLVTLGCIVPPCGVTLVIVLFGFCFFLWFSPALVFFNHFICLLHC